MVTTDRLQAFFSEPLSIPIFMWTRLDYAIITGVIARVACIIIILIITIVVLMLIVAPNPLAKVSARQVLL